VRYSTATHEWSLCVDFSDLIAELKLQPIEIPDPIGHDRQGPGPATMLHALEAQPLSPAAKKELYGDQDVPLHRFAFPEVQKLLAVGRQRNGRHRQGGTWRPRSREGRGATCCREPFG
jgi:hypothetical protein